MDAFSADIQRPTTNWLRRRITRTLAVGAFTAAAIVAPTGKAIAAAGAQPTSPVQGCTWENREGKRQFPATINPVSVRVDGSCDPDPNAPVGIYANAEQVGQPIALVNTGDVLAVHCYVSHGEVIRDARDDTKEGDEFIGRSAVWLGVTTPDGTRGKIPETWVGFPGIKTLASLKVPECPTQ